MSNQEFALAIDHHLTNAARDALYEGAPTTSLYSCGPTRPSSASTVKPTRSPTRSRARSPTSPAPA